MALATSADVRTVYAASAMETEIHRLSAELSSRWSLSTIDGDDLTQTSFRRHQRNITWPILVPPHSPVSPLDAELPGFPVLPERPRSPLRLTFGSARRSTRRSQTITPPPPEKDFNSYNYSSVQFPERIHTRISLSSSGTIISEKRASVQVHDRGSVQSSAPEVDSIEEQKSSCSKPLPITTVGQRYSQMPPSAPPLTSRDLEDQPDGSSLGDYGKPRRSQRQCVLVASLLVITFAAIAIAIVVVIIWQTREPSTSVQSAKV